jgi:nicotinamide phosphoribosyltransferase
LGPDSGDPVDILCGLPKAIENGWDGPEERGVIELLWDVFGGTTSSTGYKVLIHILVQSTEIVLTMKERKEFLRLEDKGFASTNVVLGMSSYSFNL